MIWSKHPIIIIYFLPLVSNNLPINKEVIILNNGCTPITMPISATERFLFYASPGNIGIIKFSPNYDRIMT